MQVALASPSSSRPTSPSPSDQSPTPNVRSPPRPPPFRFTWDASRPRGPGSVASDANESRLDLSTGNDYTTGGLAGYDLSDLNSSSFSPEWSSSTHGFNAISTVMNNPRKKSVPLKLSRAQFPPAVAVNLPRVRRRDFEQYLKAITPEWEEFERNNAAAVASSQADLGFETTAEARTRALKGKTREVPPLSTVPSVFFDSSFDLGNPRTFAAVTEQDASSSSSSSSATRTLNPEDISLNQILQEKLSHYMDVVEQHLTQEIQSRSTSFFAALSNLQDLQTEGADCLDRISRLRDQLKEVDDRIAKKGLQTVRLRRRRSNTRVVEQAVSTVKEVRDMLSMSERLVNEGDWDEALSLLNVLENLTVAAESRGEAHDDDDIRKGASPPAEGLRPKGLENTSGSSGPPSPSPSSLASLGAHPDPDSSRPRTTSGAEGGPYHTSTVLPFSLSSLAALSSLPTRIQDLTRRISDSLSRTLIDLLREDLAARYSSSQSTEWNEKDTEKLRERFAPLWDGLLRTGGVPEVLSRYRDMALTEVRICVRKSLPHKSDIDDEDEGEATPNKKLSERSASLAKDLRGLSHVDFLALSRTMHTGMLRCLDGVAEHAKLFNIPEDISIRISDEGRAANQQALDSVLSDVLPATTELANIRISKVVLVRAEQHAALGLAEFMEWFNEGWGFVLKCEVMARKMIVGLRGVMVSQAKAFLSNFHASRISSSATLVENEVWAQVEVPPSAQRWVDLLVESAVSDPPEFNLRPSHGGSEGNGTSQQINSPPTASGSPEISAKYALVEGRPYFVVSATLKVIEMLLDYLKVIVNLSLLTTDTMSRTIEYLKAFNSRTCQVVLGAGAMRSAGLKNITAKHLALASQSLSVMIALIPYVRETFRRHLNPKQAVMLIEFDKLKRDYHEHQNEIHGKLIAIMGDRLTAHCKSLHAINWDDDSSSTKSPYPYMEMLIKETLTLHKVLSKYLASQAVELIISQVLADINHRLSEEYGKIVLPSQEAKDRLLQDARYLGEKLSGLKGIQGSPSGMLEMVVKEKTVPLRRSPFARKVSGHTGAVGTLVASSSAPALSTPTPTPASDPPPQSEESPKDTTVGAPPPVPEKEKGSINIVGFKEAVFGALSGKGVVKATGVASSSSPERTVDLPRGGEDGDMADGATHAQEVGSAEGGPDEEAVADLDRKESGEVEEKALPTPRNDGDVPDYEDRDKGAVPADPASVTA